MISFAKFVASGKVQAKKNLGLMQMQYKNVYVAYVSMGANPAATVKAFNEAENYDGPALIVAYARRPLRSASPLLRNLPYELRSLVHLHRAGSLDEDGSRPPAGCR